MQDFLNDVYEELNSINKWGYFAIICFISVLITFINQEFIIGEVVAFEIMEKEGKLGLFNLISSLNYVFLPLYLGWKIMLTAFLLWLGCFLFGYNIKYGRLWHITLMAETIFIIPALIACFWFLFIHTEPDYWEIQAFFPLSLMNLFDYETLSKRWYYPLKSLNVFEICFTITLIYFLHFTAKKKFHYAVKIVLSSYVLFFLLWLGFYIIVYD